MTLMLGTPPYPEGHLFLADGGLETTLGYLEGVDVPEVAAYGLLRTDESRRALEDYYVSYAELARSWGVGVVLDTPTRRASADWGDALGDDSTALDWFNGRAVGLLLDVRARYASAKTPVVISGAVGRRSGSRGNVMTASAAAAYHGPQVRELAEGGVDVITARSMTGSKEATGIADAAAANGIPCTVSFTITADGCLPGGETLAAAIGAVDRATGASVHSFMIDCAPVEQIVSVLDAATGSWTSRLVGIRAHGSALMGQDLVQTAADQAGDPAMFGDAIADLSRHSPQLMILGGCCGTDERHLEAVACRVCAPTIERPTTTKARS